MSETRDRMKQRNTRALRSQFVTLIVERGADGHPRLVLEGASMAASGFGPGDTVEAIIQPDLVSILRLD